jgi:hypothetical protein
MLAEVMMSPSRAALFREGLAVQQGPVLALEPEDVGPSPRSMAAWWRDSHWSGRKMSLRGALMVMRGLLSANRRGIRRRRTLISGIFD